MTFRKTSSEMLPVARIFGYTIKTYSKNLVGTKLLNIKQCREDYLSELYPLSLKTLYETLENGEKS